MIELRAFEAGALDYLLMNYFAIGQYWFRSLDKNGVDRSF
jgi:hypothetical protein